MSPPLAKFLQLPVVTAMVAALAVAGGAALIDARENQSFASQQRITLAGTAGALSDRIAQQMNLYVGALYSAEAVLLATPKIDADAFDAIARTIARELPALSFIEVAPDAVVRYSFPLSAGPAAVGLDLRRDLPPAAVELVEQTIREGRVRVVGPGNLAQGGKGIVARNPIYVGTGGARRFWGFVTIIVDYPTFIAEFPGLTDDDTVEYALRGMDGLGAEGGVFLGRAELFEGDVILADIEFPHGGWQLAAQPRGGWHQQRPNAPLFRGLAALLAVGVGLLTWLVRRRGADLLRLATIDGLTGALSRGHFSALAHSEIARAQRTPRPLALLLFDIDHFKQVNDSYGHAAGDAVLRALGGRMLHLVREGNPVGRLGGEEFAILAPDTDARQALELAERVRLAIAAMSVMHGGQELHCTLSGGLAWLDADTATLDALLAKADEALYRAKLGGRNRVAVAS